MIVCNVNNSISHPPHPRRAVTANVPPGAFFIPMAFRYNLSILCLAIVTTSFVFGDASDGSAITDKIAEFRLKSNAHSKYVAELLANPSESRVLSNQSADANLEVESGDNYESTNELPVVDLSGHQSPWKVIKEPRNQHRNSEIGEKESHLNQKELDVTMPALEANQENASITYDELYSPKVPQRRIGYYFGPFISAIFPDDSSIRGAGLSGYTSKSGVATGVRVGNDFGSARIEGEYAFLTHEISGYSSGAGRNNIHDLKGRLILEKNLGERTDLRLGVGLGVAFVNKSLGLEDYNGIGFSYDFLLGWSFRVTESWSLNMDYKHYLTAAHKNYDRLQGHMIEVSASFDL
jgi:hypothetical protein